jgi:hypothetical protein
MKKLLPLLVLVPFTLWSSMIVVEHGYFGFLTLALREPWAMQLLVDLTISCILLGGFIVVDAKKQGISPIPYLVVMVFLGSVGSLAYFVRRAFVPGSRAAATLPST